MLDDLKTLVDQLSNLSDKDEIISKLQKINECFLTNYKLNFEYEGKTINIIPIETEIYYHNENIDKNIFEDKMIHKNDLQKNNFSRLYFHRIQDRKEYKNIKWGNKKQDPIDLKSCGVDVCISNSENYYLSILIRSAFINVTEKEEDMCSGINKICRNIIDVFKPEDNLQYFFNELEDITDVIKKRTEYINIENIFYQQRIAGDHYSKSNTEELNCLNLGEEDGSKDKKGKDNYKYLNYIISKKQTFYKVSENIKRIKNGFEKQKN